MYEKQETCFSEIERVRTYLSELIGENIYLRNSDKDGYYFETTKKRASKISELLKKRNPECIKISTSTAHAKMTSDNIRSLSDTYVSLKHQIETITHNKVKEIVCSYYEKYYESCLKLIIESMAWLDVFYSYALNALQWNYVRPTLSNSESSFVHAKNLRHPIIEQLLSKNKQAFIANDVCLSGTESYLLYGVNSVGKSSLLKSIALSVFMAQAGMYVPASNYTLCPYEKVMVRIGNSDNLFESHSSFICEIREANTCVKNADHRSLVIADEFCASTERDSASQIVTTMLQWLHKKKSSYIFATHLFELLDTTTNLTHLRVAHLKVRVDENGLIFDRKLTEGAPNERNYGTMVAEKIFKESVFLKMLKKEIKFIENQNVKRRDRGTILH